MVGNGMSSSTGLFNWPNRRLDHGDVGSADEMTATNPRAPAPEVIFGALSEGKLGTRIIGRNGKPVCCHW